VAIGMLMRVFPPDLVDEAVDYAGAREQRERDLPARLTVYFTLALWLYVTAGYEYVMARLVDGLMWARRGLGEWRVPRAASLSRARDRLGPDALHLLFERVAGPIGTPTTAGAYWRDLRVVSLDGATLDVPSTPANDLTWGRPQDQDSATASPQVRLLALAECGTHAMIDATFGPHSMEDQYLARRLLRHCRPGMVLLADLGSSVGDLWVEAAQTGAALIWRLPGTQPPTVREVLTDGTYLSQLDVDNSDVEAPVDIRVIRGIITCAPEPQPFSLATTLTDPEHAPRAEVAQLYLDRWDLPSAIDVFNTESPGEAKISLRSRTPHGVAQEIWAMFCVFHAFRDLTAQVGAGDASPAQITFP
jgi:hypothetical protein